MATDIGVDEGAPDVLIAGENARDCAAVALFVSGNGLHARICRRVADAPWLLTYPHRVELVLYLKDAVGLGVRAAASELSIDGVEVPAVPAAWVEGQPGDGTLPSEWTHVCAAMSAVKAEFDSGEGKDGRSAPETRPRTPHPPRPDVERRVLLVEDDPFLARAVARKLERLGYIVVIAHSALEAREIADASFAYALVDHSLPDPEGLALGEWLASLPYGIAVAVYSGAFDCALAVRAHKREVLAVPRPGPAELVMLLTRLQARRQSSLDHLAEAKSITSRHRRLQGEQQPVSGAWPIVRTARAMPLTFRLRTDGLHIEGEVETVVIALRSAERRILTILALARGSAVPRETLGRAALGRTDAGAGQSVKQHVSTLRGKLSEYQYDYLLRTSKDGKGYALTHPVLLESVAAVR